MLFSFDSKGIIQHDIENGTAFRLPEAPPVVNNFVTVEFVQPEPTHDAVEGERRLLHSIINAAAVVLDSPELP